MIASSTEVNEQTMRRKDGSGEKELRAAVSVIWDLSVSIAGGWNKVRSSRSVTRRVFVGGDGCEREGTELRSRERGV